MGTPPDRSEVARRSRRGSILDKAWFWLPILPMVALDLWSKAHVLSWLAAEQPNRMELRREVAFDLLPEPFGFSLVHWENNGTIWGLFQEYTSPLMVLRSGVNDTPCGA